MVVNPFVIVIGGLWLRAAGWFLSRGEWGNVIMYLGFAIAQAGMVLR